MSTTYKTIAGETFVHPVAPNNIQIPGPLNDLSIQLRRDDSDLKSNTWKLYLQDSVSSLTLLGDTTTADVESMELVIAAINTTGTKKGGAVTNLTINNIGVTAVATDSSGAASQGITGSGTLTMLNSTTDTTGVLQGWKTVSLTSSQAGTLKDVGSVTMTASSTAGITGVTGNVILLDASKGGDISKVGGSVSLKASTATSIADVTSSITLSDGAAGGAISKVAGNITANGGSFTTATGITGDVIVSGGGFFGTIDGADDVVLNGARASGTYKMTNIRGDITATDIGTRATLDVSNLTGKLTANNTNLTLSGTIDRDLANIAYGSGNTDRAVTYTVDDRAGINDGSNAVTIKLDGNANVTYKLANNTDHNTLTGVSKLFTIYLTDVGNTTGEKQVVTIQAAGPAIEAGNLKVVVTDGDADKIQVNLYGQPLDEKYITYASPNPTDPVDQHKPTDTVIPTSSKFVNPEAYAVANTDLVAAFGFDPKSMAVHFDTYGFNEGRKVFWGFSASAYLAANEDLARAFGADLDAAMRHFFQYGQYEGRKYDPAFTSWQAYAAANPDLLAAFGADGSKYVLHYATTGKAEGRQIANFDLGDYLYRNADVRAAYGDNVVAVIKHYIDTGKAEGRVAVDDSFDVRAYDALNPDLKVAGVDTIAELTAHYAGFGKPEGRPADWDTYVGEDLVVTADTSHVVSGYDWL